MTEILYNLTSNVTDMYEWVNLTISNVCVDPTNTSTCGAWIFGNTFLFFFALFLFTGFRTKTDMRGAFAGSSVITAFISVLFAVLQWIGPETVIFVTIIAVFGIIALFSRKVEYIR